MNAIVEIAGFQYRVSKNNVLNVPELDAKEGEVIRIPKVLAISDGDDVKIGSPFLLNAYVDIKVLKSGKAPKILVYKYKKRKKYRRIRGHRQGYTQIQIVDIGLEEAKKIKAEEAMKPEKPKQKRKTRAVKKSTPKKESKKPVKPQTESKRKKTKQTE